MWSKGTNFQIWKFRGGSVIRHGGIAWRLQLTLLNRISKIF